MAFASSSKVAVIGDVHAQDALLERALAWAKDLGCGQIWCVGDVADGQGNVSRCVDLLANAGAIVVRGNHDRWRINGAYLELDAGTYNDRAATLEKMSTWPSHLVLLAGATRFLLCHGCLELDEVGLTDQGPELAVEAQAQLKREIAELKVQVIVCGHTHRAGVYRYGNWTVCNAGTLRPHRDPKLWVIDAVGARMISYPLLHELGSGVEKFSF